MRMRLPLLLVGLAFAAVSAEASELERLSPVAHAETAKECGECHMAFQPALLPAASWTLVMDGLKEHFGENAEFPRDTSASIREYLATHAGRNGDPRLMRITKQRWFVREHRYPQSVWQRPDIRSKANCPACHPRAEVGMYGDD
jgi:hypothetical protein